MSTVSRGILSPELLQRVRERAPEYDRLNTFFWEDLSELRDAGYLRPRSLTETVREHRLLAAHAPATALGLSMHLVWVSVARMLQARGDSSLDWVLADAEAGELFAFGNSESGNDRVMLDSVTVASPQSHGGYTFTGTKIFTSLSPAWTRLGIFGRDNSNPEAPTLVHGFLSRTERTPGSEVGDLTPERSGVAGLSIKDDWNTLGMRATQSRTTVLNGVEVSADRIIRTVPVGDGSDALIFAIFASFETIISSVYAGIADRALELGVAAAKSRLSLANGGASYASDPDIRWQLAEAAIARDALEPQLRAVADDVDAQVDRSETWFRDLVGLKTRSVATARSVVDVAIRVSGGSSFRATSELSRLYRDVLAGTFHPSDPESAHSTVANHLLGLP
ncbi:MAG: acyl-CoA dehydrogenase family protein [Rhodoglobus sp.]